MDGVGLGQEELRGKVFDAWQFLRGRADLDKDIMEL